MYLCVSLSFASFCSLDAHLSRFAEIFRRCHFHVSSHSFSLTRRQCMLTFFYHWKINFFIIVALYRSRHSALNFRDTFPMCSLLMWMQQFSWSRVIIDDDGLWSTSKTREQILIARQLTTLHHMGRWHGNNSSFTHQLAWKTAELMRKNEAADETIKVTELHSLQYYFIFYKKRSIVYF